MTESVSRELVEAFYAAYASQDTEKLSGVLHDDITWVISGPIDVLPFCGTRRGKAAVLDLAGRVVPSLYRVVSFKRESLVVDGDRAATLNRLSGRRCADGRTFSYRLAHFLRFRDGKVIENISLIDSFDAAEQMLGHRLDVGDEPGADLIDLPIIGDAGGLVAV
jgi:ketosteroid isomerase-like protein